jgi:hypothetical protein
MAAAELASEMSSRMAGTLSRALRGSTSTIARLSDSNPREVVDDIYSCALKKQTGDICLVLSFLPIFASLHSHYFALLVKPNYHQHCGCMGDPRSQNAGVSLKYMLDFGANPIERQLLISAQFLHKELPVRLAHRVAELENLPFGLSAKTPVLKASFLVPTQLCARFMHPI